MFLSPSLSSKIISQIYVILKRHIIMIIHRVPRMYRYIMLTLMHAMGSKQGGNLYHFMVVFGMTRPG